MPHFLRTNFTFAAATLFLTLTISGKAHASWRCTYSVPGGKVVSAWGDSHEIANDAGYDLCIRRKQTNCRYQYAMAKKFLYKAHNLTGGADCHNFTRVQTLYRRNTKAGVQ